MGKRNSKSIPIQTPIPNQLYFDRTNWMLLTEQDKVDNLSKYPMLWVKYYSDISLDNLRHLLNNMGGLQGIYRFFSKSREASRLHIYGYSVYEYYLEHCNVSNEDLCYIVDRIEKGKIRLRRGHMLTKYKDIVRYTYGDEDDYDYSKIYPIYKQTKRYNKIYSDLYFTRYVMENHILKDIFYDIFMCSSDIIKKNILIYLDFARSYSVIYDDEGLYDLLRTLYKLFPQYFAEIFKRFPIWFENMFTSAIEQYMDSFHLNEYKKFSS